MGALLISDMMWCSSNEMQLLMCSDGVVGDDTVGLAADSVVAVATQPASATVNNAASVPSSSLQYDTSGMTELSLLTDEVLRTQYFSQ